mgnify:CR=1 FL=1
MELYGNTRVAAGIMAFAELQDGDRVKSVLEAQIAAAPDRFRGIRRTGAWDADPRVTRAKSPGMFLDRKFREGFSALASFNLVFFRSISFKQGQPRLIRAKIS